jgi:hypothetical protein
VPWYSDVAKRLKGLISDEEFERIVAARYSADPYYRDMADFYRLMAFVLNGDWEALRAFVERNQASFEERVSRQVLYKKEWERAKAELALHP